MKEQTLTRKNALTLVKKCLVTMLVISIVAAMGIMFVYADIDDGALTTVMETVLEIVTTAAKYVGAIIILWGVFQIIMALRREDSEAVGKQTITVVVGAVLLGFGLTAKSLYEAMIG